jgi:hypothetical protein
MPSDWNINVAGVQGQQGPSGGPAGVNGAGYLATSTTNAPIATGSVTVTTQAGLAYSIGARVRLSSHSAPSQWIEGLCTAYVGTSLTVNVDLTSGMVPAFVYLVPILANYLGGLTLANDATSPNTVLDIATGCATSDDSSTIMSLSVSGFSKNCNAAWAVGGGNGALDSGASLAASTWYHVFVIMRIDTNIVDVLISTSVTAPTLPTSYTKKRRIGSILTNASAQITAFNQVGDDFIWITPTVSVSSGWVAGVNPVTMSVPPGVKVTAYLSAFLLGAGSGSNTYAIIRSMDATGDTSSVSSQNSNIFSMVSQAAAGDFRVRTNTSAQVAFYGFSASSAGATVTMVTKGWLDNRGK